MAHAPRGEFDGAVERPARHTNDDGSHRTTSRALVGYDDTHRTNERDRERAREAITSAARNSSKGERRERKRERRRRKEGEERREEARGNLLVAQFLSGSTPETNDDGRCGVHIRAAAATHGTHTNYFKFKISTEIREDSPIKER